MWARFLTLFLGFSIELPLFASNAYDWYKKAKEAVEKKEYVLALENYRKSLNLRPTYLPALLDYVELLLKMGYVEEAFPLAERSLKLEKQNPRAQELYARSLLAKGELDGARDFLQKEIEKSPENPEFLYLMSQYHLRKGQLFAARQKLQKILKRQPGHLGSYLLLAEVFSREGRYDLAQKQLEQAQRIEKENPEILVAMGDNSLRHLLKSMDMDFHNTYPSPSLFDVASHYYENALGYDPHLFSANLALSRLKVLMRRCDEAQPLIERVLQLNPHFFEALYLNGYCQKNLVPTLYRKLLQEDGNNDILRHSYERHLVGQRALHGSLLLESAKYHLDEANRLLRENLMDKALFEAKLAIYLYDDLPQAHEFLLEYYRTQKDFSHFEQELKWLRQNTKKQLYRDLWEKWIHERRELPFYKEGLYKLEDYVSRTPVYIFPFTPNEVQQMYPDAGLNLAEKIDLALRGRGRITSLPANDIEQIRRELKNLTPFGDGGQYTGRTAQRLLELAEQRFGQDLRPLWLRRPLQYALTGTYDTNGSSISFQARLIDLRSGLTLAHHQGHYKGRGYLRDAALSLAQFLEQNTPYYGHVIKIARNGVLINLGRRDKMKKGQKVQVLREERPIGELTITRTEMDLSWAEIPFSAEQKEIQSGDMVKPIL
ncbi:MAG: tetratricopeptide repeat protein [Leptospiraceae bacterium]|nr:tetratricopeptide repeat protein [Leptospiraceae bacterium]